MSINIATAPIVIYQKNFAFTTSESPKTSIETTSFGPCHVVVFRANKFKSSESEKKDTFVAMTHMDDKILVKPSIKLIFDRFLTYGIQPKDIRVTIMGGWEEHAVSNSCGKAIVNEINQFGVMALSTQNMYKKKNYGVKDFLAKSNPKDHYFSGARVDAVLDKVYIFNDGEEINEREEQNQKNVFEYEKNFKSTQTVISEIK